MVLEVHTDDLVAAGAALRRIGDGVSSYGHQLDHRVGAVATGVDGEVGSSLTRAWDDVSQALDELAAGFETYGRALDDIAAHYAEIDAALAAQVEARSPTDLNVGRHARTRAGAHAGVHIRHRPQPPP